MKLRILLFMSFLFLLVSCDSKDSLCDSILPAPPITRFMLVDSSSGESLIGQNGTYNPDTINSLNFSSQFRIYENQDTIVEWGFWEVISGSNVLFQLSETEVDTIRIEYTIRQGECFSSKELERFHYNNELIEPENGLHVIEK